ADHQHVVLCLDFAGYVRFQLSITGIDLARFQRTSEGAHHSTSSGGDDVVDRGGVRFRELCGIDFVVLGDGAVDAENNRLGLARKMRDAKRPLLSFERGLRNVDDVAHGFLPRGIKNKCRTAECYHDRRWRPRRPRLVWLSTRRDGTTPYRHSASEIDRRARVSHVACYGPQERTFDRAGRAYRGVYGCVDRIAGALESEKSDSRRQSQFARAGGGRVLREFFGYAGSGIVRDHQFHLQAAARGSRRFDSRDDERGARAADGGGSVYFCGGDRGGFQAAGIDDCGGGAGSVVWSGHRERLAEAAHPDWTGTGAAGRCCVDAVVTAQTASARRRRAESYGDEVLDCSGREFHVRGVPAIGRGTLRAVHDSNQPAGDESEGGVSDHDGVVRVPDAGGEFPVYSHAAVQPESSYRPDDRRYTGGAAGGVF